MDHTQSFTKLLANCMGNVDNFPVGAASVYDSTSLESEINALQSKIHRAEADALILQALTTVAKNVNADKDRNDDTHIAKYENALVDDASAINLPQTMAIIAYESEELLKALKMSPEEMEHQSSSCRSLLRRIKNIAAQCSSTQLELLEIQKDINKKLRQIEEMEYVLLKKQSKLASDLVEQRKQLDKMKGSKDEGYDRKKKRIQATATEINTMKIIIQGLIYLSPENLEENTSFLEILEYTRKPLNLVTYSTQV